METSTKPKSALTEQKQILNKERRVSRCLSLLRIFVYSALLVPVAYESFHEISNYASGIRSTAIQTREDKNLKYPNIVICTATSFKGNTLIMSTDEYLNNTYSIEEVFNTSNTCGDFTISTIHTRFKGRCFVIEPKETMSYTDYIGFRILDLKKARVHLVRKHQELCVIMGYCNNPYDSRAAIRQK
jgi:hypothetical protein